MRPIGEPALERMNFDEVTRWDWAIHVARYQFASKYVQGQRVLDCACGPGYGSTLLARAGSLHVIGADVSMDAIQVAQKEFELPNVRFMCQDAQSIELAPGSLDLVVTMETLEHLDEPSQYLRRAWRALSPDGRLIASIPNGAVLNPGEKFSQFHKREYSLRELAEMLSPFFSNLEFFYQPFPDQRVLMLRQLNRASQRGLLASIKGRLPRSIKKGLKAIPLAVAQHQNETSSPTVFLPRPIVNMVPPPDACVLIAVCSNRRTWPGD